MSYPVPLFLLFSRYADIVVHRLLASSLGIDPLPAAVQDRERVHDMAEVINHRHRMAQLVSRASSELFTLIFFQDKNIEEDAMVVAVKSNGIRVMVPRFGIESGITLWQESAFDEEESSAVERATSVGNKNPWKLDEIAMTLSGPGGVKFTIFEQVRVRIYVQESKLRRKWLQIDLIDKTTSQPQADIAKHLQATAIANNNPTASSPSPSPSPSTTSTPAAASSKKRQLSANSSDSMEVDPPTATASSSTTKNNASGASAKKKSKAKSESAPPTKKQKV